MIEVDKSSFHEQNLRCRFQACALECRVSQNNSNDPINQSMFQSQLIKNICPLSARQHTLQTVRQYYIADLKSDWHEFRKDEKAHLFSRFCRRMLNDQEVSVFKKFAIL